MGCQRGVSDGQRVGHGGADDVAVAVVVVAIAVVVVVVVVVAIVAVVKRKV